MRDLARSGRFQHALWRLYDAPALSAQLSDAETLICRCENVTRCDIDAALDAGARGLGAVKRATRLGMGRCQGRYCAPLAAGLAAARQGRTPAPLDFFAPRTPLRPVSIAALANLDLAPHGSVSGMPGDQPGAS